MATKYCAKCNTRHSTLLFNKDSSRKDGLYPYCRECQRAKNAAIYQQQQPARLVKAAIYREGHRDGIREKMRKYHADRPGQLAERMATFRVAHPDRARQIAKRYRQNNHDKILDRVHVRRARKQQNGPVEKINRRKVHERDGGICHICNMPVSLLGMHLDHVVPVARGGTHTYANVKAAHGRCNLVKGNRLMEELQCL